MSIHYTKEVTFKLSSRSNTYVRPKRNYLTLETTRLYWGLKFLFLRTSGFSTSVIGVRWVDQSTSGFRHFDIRHEKGGVMCGRDKKREATESFLYLFISLKLPEEMILY